MRDAADGYEEVGGFPPVRYADEDEDGARAQVFAPKGREIFIEGRAHRYDSLNPTVAAQNSVRRAREREAQLKQEDRRVGRACWWTRRTITATSSERIGRRRPFLQGLQALGFAVLAGFALYISVIVLSAYIVGSGSDLFAARPNDAGWFAVTAILAAGGIKAFEKQLLTDTARHLYRSIFFAVGVSSFVLWSVMAAIAFAPDMSGGRAWITGGSGNSTTIVLVLTHLLCDVAWGYLLFSAADEWLNGNYKRIEVANPRYLALCEARSKIAHQLETCSKAIDAAENYLAALAAGRRDTAAMAEATYARAYQMWEQAEARAIADMRGNFLTFQNPSN